MGVYKTEIKGTYNAKAYIFKTFVGRNMSIFSKKDKSILESITNTMYCLKKKCENRSLSDIELLTNYTPNFYDEFLEIGQSFYRGQYFKDFVKQLDLSPEEKKDYLGTILVSFNRKKDEIPEELKEEYSEIIFEISFLINHWNENQDVVSMRYLSIFQYLINEIREYKIYRDEFTHTELKKAIEKVKEDTIYIINKLDESKIVSSPITATEKDSAGSSLERLKILCENIVDQSLKKQLNDFLKKAEVYLKDSQDETFTLIINQITDIFERISEKDIVPQSVISGAFNLVKQGDEFISKELNKLSDAERMKLEADIAAVSAFIALKSN